MRTLCRVGLVAVVLTSAAAVSLAAYATGYREGLRVNSQRVQTPPLNGGRSRGAALAPRRPTGMMGKLTISAPLYDKR